ncbi:DNA topoisomerase VI subunit B [Candidatus Woesearchaeota archaeon]|nr:MAG: DNA topoisomerase VI subunit B [Candidatus Woesearchaeota archaeon]
MKIISASGLPLPKTRLVAACLRGQSSSCCIRSLRRARACALVVFVAPVVCAVLFTFRIVFFCQRFFFSSFFLCCCFLLFFSFSFLVSLFFVQRSARPKSFINGWCGRSGRECAVSVKAEELAKKQRAIGVAEFFERNRHLLGFDNPRKALLTTVKEAVDNALDACEEAGFLPELIVEIVQLGEQRFRIVVEDNGPGIVKAQIPKIFAKLLYGSKFHTRRQQRGQQGIGISAAVMYAQLMTGRSAKIVSKTGKARPAHYYELHIDTQRNEPKVLKDEVREWKKEHGTRIELDLEAVYMKGSTSVDEYLKETAIANPHATIVYVNPKAEQIIFPRATEEAPKLPKEVKPHPYGVELGVLLKMAQQTRAKTLQQFLTSEFSRVSANVAKEICQHAKLLPSKRPVDLGREQVESLYEAIQKTKIIAPSTDCISPIGADVLEKGLRKEVNAEFYAAVTRPPAVYRGNPFQIECAVAYGGAQPGDKQATLLRFANRVPLLYQQGACAMTKAVVQTKWSAYGLKQSNGSLPVAPLTIVVHIASVWVPFTSESKEAIAQYPEIIKEMKLALQEVGRRLGSYVRKKYRVRDELKKRAFIEKYLPHMAGALQELLDLDEKEKERLEKELERILEQKRGKIESLEFDASKNVEFDEAFAKIGRGEDEEEVE